MTQADIFVRKIAAQLKDVEQALDALGSALQGPPGEMWREVIDRLRARDAGVPERCIRRGASICRLPELDHCRAARQ